MSKLKSVGSRVLSGSKSFAKRGLNHLNKNKGVYARKFGRGVKKVGKGTLKAGVYVGKKSLKYGGRGIRHVAYTEYTRARGSHKKFYTKHR